VILCLDSLDDQGDPNLGYELASKLVTRRDVLAVIGPGQSSVASRAMEVYRKARIPVILPSATNPDVTRGLGTLGVDHVFRLGPTDIAQAACIAGTIKEHDESNNVVAILYDASNRTYSDYLSSEILAELESCESCPTVVFERQLVRGTGVYVAQEMAGLGAGLVVFVGEPGNATRVVRQIQMLQWSPKLILTDSSFYPRLHDQLVGLDATITIPLGPGDRDGYPVTPDNYRQLGSDAIGLLLSAANALDPRALSPVAVTRELNRFRIPSDGRNSGYRGQAGTYLFDSDGNNLRGVFHKWRSTNEAGWQYVGECPGPQ
jgi:hypothetical protein